MYWWIHLYGGPTPKRHVGISNSRHIKNFDVGKLTGWKKKKQEIQQGGQEVVRLVRRYIDKQGKPRYHGLPALKGSESGSQSFFLFHSFIGGLTICANSLHAG